MRRIAFVCEKGGTGKTTTATAVAVGLARRGSRVLFIDADQQANATWTLLGGQGADAPTLAAVLTRQAAVVEAIRPTPTQGLDLLPADASLGGVNVALAQELGRDSRLRSALATVEGRYDFVLIDTGPQFTTILANVLVYSTEVIVPLDLGVYAMLGVVQLQETIAEVREAYGNTSLHLAGLILTKISRNNVSRDVEAELRNRFGERVFKATVPLSAKVEEAHTHGQTIMTYAPKSVGATAYGQLIEEIVSYGRDVAKGGGRGKVVRGPGADHAA
jgi:chromosome partitioning protein